MKIINTTASIPYPPLLIWNKPVPPDGWAEFPEAFVPVFYQPGKRAAGFVDITVDGNTVTSCTWDEDAYQAYIASLPEPDPSESPDVPESDTAVWEQLDAAYREGVESAYDS